jgi:hypothetical protein
VGTTHENNSNIGDKFHEMLRPTAFAAGGPTVFWGATNIADRISTPPPVDAVIASSAGAVPIHY